MVEQLINKGANLNLQDMWGNTALMKAAELSLFPQTSELSLPIVELLLKAGADPNIENIKGMSALFSASDRSPEIARLLLKAGAKIDIQDKEGNTVLMMASIDSPKVVEILLNADADPNMVNKKGETALIIGIENGQSEIVRLLLDKGADPNVVDGEGNTTLSIAIKNNQSEIVRLLLDKGADPNMVNKNGETVLSDAVYLSQYDTVKLLLDRGVDPTNSDILEYASNDDIVEILLEYGADPFVGVICSTEKCVRLISQKRWERLYSRDQKEASALASGTSLPRDVWEMILLNKRQQQLCQNLSSDRNYEILVYFAMELNIPNTYGLTKPQLCAIISRQLAYGKIFSDKPQRELEAIRRNIRAAGMKLGLNPDDPIEDLLLQMSQLLTYPDDQ